MKHSYPNDIESLVDSLTGASGHEARIPIRDALRELGCGHAGALVPHLDHPDCFTRWELVSLLGELAEDETAADVVAFALGEDEVHARWRSFWAVSRFSAETTLPLLRKALKSRGDKRRWRAALILSMLGEREATDAIRKGLAYPDEWRQWEALSALKSLGAEGVEDDIRSFLQPDRSRSLRQEAVLALGAIGSVKARRMLRKSLNDTDPQVRWRASMSLSRVGNPVDRASLEKRLTVENDGDVKEQLVSDIRIMGDNHGKTNKRRKTVHRDGQ